LLEFIDNTKVKIITVTRKCGN